MNNNIEKIIHGMTDRRIRIVFIKRIIQVTPGEIKESEKVSVHK